MDDHATDTTTRRDYPDSPTDQAHKRGLVTGLVVGIIGGGIVGGIIGAAADRNYTNTVQVGRTGAPGNRTFGTTEDRTGRDSTINNTNPSGTDSGAGAAPSGTRTNPSSLPPGGNTNTTNPPR